MSVARFTLSLDEKQVFKPLVDYPRSEHWRLLTDGWQHVFGPAIFSPEYYASVGRGFKLIQKQFSHKTKITPEFIESINQTVWEAKESGFRAQRSGVIFKLAPLKEMESTGFSEAGLDEFVKEVKRAEKEARWYLMGITRADRLQLTDDEVWDAVEKLHSGKTFVDEYGQGLKDKLSSYLKMPYESRDGIYIYGNKMPREKILQFIQRDIDELYAKLKQSEQRSISDFFSLGNNRFFAEQKQQDAKIAAIVQFIQKLNQNHWFSDCNGRTCVLLLELLLIQHLGRMAIPITPGHLTGYSTLELVQEIKNGMAEIEKYKITQLLKYLNEIDKSFIVKNESKFKLDLAEKLSPVNYIAMAQINELFLQIKENKIKMPDQAKEIAFRVLKKLYLENLHDYAVVPRKTGVCWIEGGIPFEESFKKYLAYHEITQEKDMVDDVNMRMKLYFKKLEKGSAKNLSSGGS